MQYIWLFEFWLILVTTLLLSWLFKTLQSMCMCTMSFIKKVAVHLWSWLGKILLKNNFCTAVSRKKIFAHTWKTCQSHLKNILSLWRWIIIFHTFIMHSWNIACCIKCAMKYRENKSIVTRYVQNVRHWHEHKYASMLVIGQLHHQSVTAPRRDTCNKWCHSLLMSVINSRLIRVRLNEKPNNII